jgi:hypothetical protein
MKLRRVIARPVASKSAVRVSVAVICRSASTTECTCGSCMSSCSGRYGSRVMESLWPGFRSIDRRLPVNIRVIGDSRMSCCLRYARRRGYCAGCTDFLFPPDFLPAVFAVCAVDADMMF